MYALLILDEKGGDLKILVRLREKPMQAKVSLLLENRKCREAFDLFKTRAQVEECFPAGAKMSFVPQVTLVESLL